MSLNNPSRVLSARTRSPFQIPQSVSPSQWLKRLNPEDLVRFTVKVLQRSRLRFHQATYWLKLARDAYPGQQNGSGSILLALVAVTGLYIHDIRVGGEAQGRMRFNPGIRRRSKTKLVLRAAKKAVMEVSVRLAVMGLNYLTSPLWHILKKIPQPVINATLEDILQLNPKAAVAKAVEVYRINLGIYNDAIKKLLTVKVDYDAREEGSQWAVPFLASGMEAGVLQGSSDPSFELDIWKLYRVSQMACFEAALAWSDAHDTVTQMVRMLECQFKSLTVIELLDKLSRAIRRRPIPHQLGGYEFPRAPATTLH
ncbi:hypothetical protein DFP72DRAFT_851146 [Ephemerocybe angulata]|uniref:Uncharacterized protein n=1 Tax=Ephemerocybe angulata TaxID=980116 RepID=A0A8H6HQA3_9AGAR|nr:hypothetical protein DFP72DRAFT_851146 [Tulosesus angulatus]